MFNTKEEKMLELHNQIETRYKKHHSWIDALSSYCIEFDLEACEITPYLSPSIIDKIKTEGVKNKTIKNTEATLPF